MNRKELVRNGASVRIRQSLMRQYRDWAGATGRRVSDVIEIALLSALRRQAEIERELIAKLEVKS